MTDFNPYAPPKVAKVPQQVVDARAAAKAEANANKGPDDYRVEGNEVTIKNNGQLPPICILTGAPSNRQTWDMVWKSAFATLRGRLGVYLGAAASRKRDTAKTLTWAAVLIAGVPLTVGAKLIEIGPYGWVMGISLLSIPLIPVILKTRKLYEVVDLTRDEIRIRVDPTVAMALADYRSKHAHLYDPQPGDQA